nr:condensation domain-containing protein [uncultured Flavobacterium sp.]
MEQITSQIESLSENMKRQLLNKLKTKYTECYEINPLQKAVSVEGVALSYGQKRILEMTLKYPETPVNVVSQMLNIKGDVSIELLQEAIKIVVRLHEAFKILFFHDSNGEWKQKVENKEKYLIQKNTLKDDSEIVNYVSKHIGLKNWLNKDSSNIDFLIFEKEQNNFSIAIITHNLFFDAWSYNLLIDDILNIYNILNSKEPVVLPSKEYDFLSFVNWQNNWITTKESKNQLHYWKDKFKEIKKSEFLSVKNDDIDHSYHGSRILFDLDQNIKLKIENISKEWSATPFMVLTSLIQAYIYNITSERTVLIGTINSNRTRKYSDEIVGYLLNYVPLIAHFKEQHTFEEIVRENKKNILEAFENKDIPFEFLMENIEHKSKNNLLFDLLFIYENIPVSKENYNNFSLEKQEIDRSTARFNITLAIFNDKDYYECFLEYNNELFMDTYINEFINNFKSFVKEILN